MISIETQMMGIVLEHTPVIGDLFALLVSIYFAAIVFLGATVVV